MILPPLLTPLLVLAAGHIASPHTSPGTGRIGATDFLADTVRPPPVRIPAPIDLPKTPLERAIRIVGEEVSAAEAEYLETAGDSRLDLNRISLADLMAVPGVTAEEARTLIESRRALGSIRRMSDLALIPGLGVDVMRKLEPFVTIGPPRRSVTATIQLQGTALAEGAGSLPPPPSENFPGPVMARTTVSPTEWLDLGLRFVRRPGDESGEMSLSGFTAVRAVPLDAEIVLGDFVVEAGQGFLMWGPERLRKGWEDALRSPRVAVSPFLGSGSSQFMRGGGVNLRFVAGRVLIRASTFYSSISLKGIPGRNSLIHSLSADGASDVSPSGAERIHERVFGTCVALHGGDFTAGIAGIGSFYDEPVAPRWNSVLGAQDFLACSVDGSLRLENSFIAAECVISPRGPAGALLTARTDLNSGLILYGSLRKYADVYLTRFSADEGGNGRGRKYGCLLGVRVPLVSALTLEAVIDAFRSFLEPGRPPGNGRDLFACLTFTPGPVTSQIQLRHRYGDLLSSAVDPLGRMQRRVFSRRQSWLRGALHFPLRRGLRVAAKYDRTVVSEGESGRGEQGEALSFHVDWEPLPRFALSSGLVAFGTGSYDSRLYDFDGGIPGGFSITPLYAAGTKWSALLRAAPFEGFSLYARYSNTFREEGDFGDWRPRSVRTELTVQLSVRL